ncbi:MAG: A/G-specific adenine glycosylase [Ignavibacteriales bacterium]|nr:A/G-specific adenine glycosylase [Ignavibacteriales bacterium]
MKELDTELKRSMQKAILSWYKKNKRKFLWRDNESPYVILVSEIMLQQTQVNRVKEKLPKFLKLFPSIHSLSRTSRSDVIRAWKGMGYNNRAIRLQECAKMIVERHRGNIPETFEELLELPGIGNYTASAICVFAFGKNLPVVDVNIRRVYSRMFWNVKTTSALQTENKIQQLAEEIFPKNKSSECHQAIMDIGAMFCTARSPKCNDCIVNRFCLSANKMKVVVPKKKGEKLYRGKPHRYWRGKIVDVLRNSLDGKFVSSQEVLENLFSTERKNDARFLKTIVTALTKDNVVEMLLSKGDSFLLRLSQ